MVRTAGHYELWHGKLPSMPSFVVHAKKGSINSPFLTNQVLSLGRCPRVCILTSPTPCNCSFAVPDHPVQLLLI